jgi:pimeloyl-ACP methyl ester carboxylesterase
MARRFGRFSQRYSGITSVQPAAAAGLVTDDEAVEQFRRGQYVFEVGDTRPADGPVVVLLHGHPQSNSAWEAVIPRLTERGYRCLAPNQRGHSPGARPGVAGTIEYLSSWPMSVL